MAVTYTMSQVAGKVGEARAKGLRLQRVAGERVFLATRSQDGKFAYRVAVTLKADKTALVTCDCPAGENGKHCYHGTGAVSAAWRMAASSAAKTLRAVQALPKAPDTIV